MRTYWRSFAVVAPIAFVVTLGLTYLYSLIAHGTGRVDWGTAVRLALILGLALPLVRIFGKQKRTRR